MGDLWSFVGGKRRVRWVWAARDRDTRQVVAMVVGDRSEDTARRLRAALPAADRDGAVVGPDFWSAYRAAVPEGRPAAAATEAGLTAHVERFGNTLRQRCGRLVRKTLSFSTCDRNHVGALWDFIRLDNRSRRCRP